MTVGGLIEEGLKNHGIGDSSERRERVVTIMGKWG
jgi:hypothetical protein